MSTRILAIDTATEACSAALLDNGCVETIFEVCPQRHSQRILPMVKNILARRQLNLSQLDVLAFGQGPGSFTGVRIAIGIAQGLAFGAGLPLTGISTLATMAQGVWRRHQATRVLVAIDARMGEVYWAEYQRDEQGVWHGEESEAVLTPDAALMRMATLSGDWMMAGTGWQAWPELKKAPLLLRESDIALPAAQDMLPLAQQQWRAGKTVASEDAQPVYLRNDVAWKKLPGRG